MRRPSVGWRRTNAAGSRPHRNYLLSGPVECAHCGWTYRGTCASGSRTGKRYYYYGCGRRGATYDKRVERSCPNVNAEWLEDLVRQDVSSFLENPGEVLERVREQVEDDDQANELEERRESLEKSPRQKASREGPSHAPIPAGTLLRRGS